jgi:hypothetical protein
MEKELWARQRGVATMLAIGGRTAVRVVVVARSSSLEG